MAKPDKQVIKRQIYEPFGFRIGVYDLDCHHSINQWLVERAYTLDKFSREHEGTFWEVPGADMGVRTKYNDNKESFIGAHTWIMNRCHNFPGFPEELLGKIMTCTYDYAKYVGASLKSPENCMLYLERGWSTITKPGDAIKGHNHSRHMFSSAYYPSHSPEQGDLWFDRGDPYEHFLLYEPNRGPSERSHIKVKPGQFVIFPSVAMHGTDVNKSTKDRISYSFDIDPVGLDYKLPPTKIVEDAWHDFNTTITKIGLTEALSE